jgi:anti-sigma B factor antagonist
MSPKSAGAVLARDEVLANLPQPFSVRTERDADVYLLTVIGELDLATREALHDELARAEASDAARILLDLSGVTFIDSAGICTILAASRRSAVNGRRLRLLPVSGQVRRVFELTGVLNRLEFTG